MPRSGRDSGVRGLCGGGGLQVWDDCQVPHQPQRAARGDGRQRASRPGIDALRHPQLLPERLERFESGGVRSAGGVVLCMRGKEQQQHRLGSGIRLSDRQYTSVTVRVALFAVVRVLAASLGLSLASESTVCVSCVVTVSSKSPASANQWLHPCRAPAP
eukprot:68847-Rhodomonas_salina.2